MAKRKRRGRRKGSRTPAMPHKKRRRGRRAKNATLGAGAQIALGVGGYIAAGVLGSLAQSYLLPATSSANTIRLSRTLIGAVGAVGTSMLVGESTVAGPLATGMAANVGIQILGIGADAVGVTLDNKKFLGLASSTIPSSPTSSDAAAVAAAAAAAAATAKAKANPASLTVVWDSAANTFKDASGNAVAGSVVLSRTIKDAAGNTGTVGVAGVVKNGVTYVFVSSDGQVWVKEEGIEPDVMPASMLSLQLQPAVASLSGTYPPWAGYPGYDNRQFPQQAVSRPARNAPHIQGYANYAPAMSGYANYAPAMSGYANFAPAMSGWSPGYGD